MRNWVAALFICLLIGGWLWGHQKQDVKLELTDKGGNESAEHQAQAQEQEQEQARTTTIKVSQNQIYRGNLVLINKEYGIHPEGVEADVIQLAGHQELLDGFGLLDRSIRLPQTLLQRFTDMVAAADKDGVNHFLISSGYRDQAEQEQLYADMGADYALPAGHSEHNLGLSLDIGSSLKAMNDAPEGEWLTRNADRYGFILRYPKDKTDITGIQYEPWHFRYVGLPHSRIMKENGFTLEEYLDFLKEKKSFAATVDGKRYEISYYPMAEGLEISVPSNQLYELSGNNSDGIIMTAWL
ncbi:M15 family metallopeptidase [Paenibacillus silvisoli]|uniref:M15 family metallopeptidase n=1 Tax=Paenibacillus silvisoli TaxID=3110539 RepID=UPI002805D74D|nr:M15 family metallopeptidase [Paenibacillus silvisoli]